MHLLPNWRTILWRSWAVKALGIIAAIAAAMLLPEVRELVPAEWVKYAVLAAALSGILLRILDQGITDVDADSSIDPEPH